MKRVVVAVIAVIAFAFTSMPAPASDAGVVRLTMALTTAHTMKGYSVNAFVYRVDRTQQSLDLSLPTNSRDQIACFTATKQVIRRKGTLIKVTTQGACGLIQFGFAESTWVANASGSMTGYAYKATIERKRSGYVSNFATIRQAPIVIDLTWSGGMEPDATPTTSEPAEDPSASLVMSRDATVTGVLDFRGLRTKMTYDAEPMGYLSDSFYAGATPPA